MKRCRVFLLMLLALLVGLHLTAATAAEPRHHPRIGLVLSGGGARGLAHIGVLRALEAQHIHIDAIAGTSMGAIVGALYASGKTPDEIEQIALNIDWRDVFADLPPRDRLSFRRKQDSRKNVVKTQVTLKDGVITLPKGAVQGQNLQLMLQQKFLSVSNITDFDNLAIPFRAVASDLVTGQPVVFDHGSLATAIRASMSIPGVFAPVELDGKVLVDGGIANNLPVDVVKAMGVDYVIAVDITTPLYNADQLDSVVPIIEQLTTLLTFNQQKKQYALLGDKDTLITPDLSDVASADFDKTREAIKRGYDAVMAKSNELARYAVPGPVSHTLARKYQAPIIDAIQINNQSRVSDDLIAALISQPSGEPLDEQQLEKDIESIYGYQYFDSVRYQIIQRGKSHILQIDAVGKTSGKDVLGVDFDLSTDTRAGSYYNIGLNFLKSGITSRGGEWTSTIQIGEDPDFTTELYLPLDYRQQFFVRPYASYGETNYNQVENDNIQSRFRIDMANYGVFAGIEISNKAVLGLGIERNEGTMRTFIGATAYDGEFHDRGAYALVEFDTMDNLYFPQNGTYIHFKFEQTTTGDPAWPNPLIASLDVTKAIPIASGSLVFQGRLMGSNKNALQRYQQGSLGGFLDLSGYHADALVGNNLGYASLTWLHRLNERSILPTDLPVYFGMSFEMGNTWEDHSDISLDDMVHSGMLMLGVDTLLGPVYFGYGRSETGNSALYLRLGHLF